MTNTHLAILKGEYLDAIVSGDKTIESRFTKTRRAPWGTISAGDTVYLKVTSGPVRAIAEVGRVCCYEIPGPGDIEAIRAEFGDAIGGSDEYWLDKRNSRYAVLVWLEKVRPIEPVRICKRDWRAWVVLSEDNDYGLGSVG